MTVNPIREGFHSLTPSLTVDNAAEAIEFYKKAFGAQELDRAMSPDGASIWHATLQIGDSRLMLNDEFPDMGARGPKSVGGTPVDMFLYVQNTDATFQSAIDAGATADMPPNDAFWGDRWAKVTDPFGHGWQIATHQEDVSQEEMYRRIEAMTAQEQPS